MILWKIALCFTLGVLLGESAVMLVSWIMARRYG
jgi:hypothetical protein